MRVAKGSSGSLGIGGVLMGVVATSSKQASMPLQPLTTTPHYNPLSYLIQAGKHAGKVVTRIRAHHPGEVVG